MTITREQFIENQVKYCHDKGIPFFMPSKGHCFKCNGDFVSRLIAEGKQGNEEMIEHCSICNWSFTN